MFREDPDPLNVSAMGNERRALYNATARPQSPVVQSGWGRARSQEPRDVDIHTWLAASMHTKQPPLPSGTR